MRFSGLSRVVILFRRLLGAVLVTSALNAEPAPPVVTITDVGRPTPAQAIQLTDADLMALPQHTYRIKFPWESRDYDFSGPLLRDVLTLAKVTGTTLKVFAFNGYSVEIPRSDGQDLHVIVACRRNNLPMRVRDKGPLILVYPFNTRPDLRTEVYYARCVWQVSRIDVAP